MCLKVIGVLIVITACSLMGFALANEYIAKINNLDAFKKSLRILKGKIKYDNLSVFEAMELIKGIVGSKVCAMYYNKKKGISSKSKKIGKRRVEKNIQNAKTITYSGSEYIRKIELHGIKGKFKFSPCSSIVILF